MAITAGYNTFSCSFVSVLAQSEPSGKTKMVYLVVSFVTLKELTNETIEEEFTDLR